MENQGIESAAAQVSAFVLILVWIVIGLGIAYFVFGVLLGGKNKRK